MTLRVYNTLTRQKEDFETVVPGKVGMYLCGPTVYKPSHIGHMVGPVIFDTVKRYLTYCGFDVTYVVNITDVDDKLINRAAENETTVEELAREMTEDYLNNLAVMGVNTIDHFPRATEHIDEMLTMIGQLVDGDYAYPLNGDVYFAVERDDDYGKLSGRSLDDMIAGTRVQANQDKRNPADFALWKRSQPGEPGWDSPWGRGRPGWHIECSAMSIKYLGESFDIHGGGLDLMFPHHENELAQSECCTNRPFARYWMHNGLMQAGRAAGKLGGSHDRHGDTPISAEEQEAGKLAGSKGAAAVCELFEKHQPETVRFFLLNTHYRSPIDFSDGQIEETARSLDGFYRLFETYERVAGTSFYELPIAATAEDACSVRGDSDAANEVCDLRQRFLDVMNDDFNTGGAIGVLFELRKLMNGYIADHGLDGGTDAADEHLQFLSDAMTVLRESAALLGLFINEISKAQAADDGFAADLMELIIAVRSHARENRDFAVADMIRDGLSELKVVLEDRAEATLWRRDV